MPISSPPAFKHSSRPSITPASQPSPKCQPSASSTSLPPIPIPPVRQGRWGLARQPVRGQTHASTASNRDGRLPTSSKPHQVGAIPGAIRRRAPTVMLRSTTDTSDASSKRANFTWFFLMIAWPCRPLWRRSRSLRPIRHPLCQNGSRRRAHDHGYGHRAAGLSLL